MKLSEWDWWQKQKALERIGLDKCPINLNIRDYLLINKEITVERKFQRFEQFLRDRADFEESWRGGNVKTGKVDRGGNVGGKKKP